MSDQPNARDMTAQTHYVGCWREHHECAVAIIEQAIKYGFNGSKIYNAMKAVDGRALTHTADAAGSPDTDRPATRPSSAKP